MAAREACCASVSGGTIFVFGGVGIDNTTLASVEAFTPGIISSVASQPGIDSAVISWHTTPANYVPCELDYGLTSTYGSSVIESAGGLIHANPLIKGGWQHSAMLSGLQPNTTYHFRIMVVGSPDTATADYTFTTGAGLGITNVAVSGVGSTSATISWQTNVAATSKLEYGLTSAYGSAVNNPALATGHTINLTSLSASTLYHYRVSSTNAGGNTQMSGDQTFVTAGSSTGGDGSFSYILTRQADGSYLVKVTLTEVDYHEIGQAILFAATLDFASLGAATAPASPRLPTGFGTITPGGTSFPISLVFPASAGAPGTRVNLKLTASYTDTLLGDRLDINGSFRGVLLP